jgi:hypothetical protein
MSTRRRPTRWASIHRTRRAGRRWHSCCHGAGSTDWTRALDLDGQGPAVSSGASAPARAGSAALASPAFVELFPALPAGPSECTIELCDPSGRKLTLSLRSAPGPDLVALTQALWRGLR